MREACSMPCRLSYGPEGDTHVETTADAQKCYLGGKYLEQEVISINMPIQVSRAGIAKTWRATLGH